MSQLTIVIPAFNEEESLLTVLKELQSFCELNNYKAILLDDGSTDKTFSIASQFKFLKVLEQRNLG